MSMLHCYSNDDISKGLRPSVMRIEDCDIYGNTALFGKLHGLLVVVVALL